MVGVASVAIALLGPQALPVTEVSLGKASPNMVQSSLVTSPNGEHIAFVDKRGAKECVVLDGVAGKLYDSIPRQSITEAGVPPQIVFSPDGSRMAYVATQAGKSLVVEGTKEGKQYKSIVPGSVKFNLDGTRFAYPAATDSGEVMVVDGQESKQYDDVDSYSSQFSIDGNRHMFRATRDKKGLVVLDGTEIPEERFHGDGDFSENGHAIDVVSSDGGWIVYIDGMPSKKYSSVGNNVIFTDDDKRVLYQASDAVGDFLVVDGKETKRYPHIAEGSYGFTPGGKSYVFVVRIAAGDYVVLNDIPGESYSWVSEPVFTQDGSSMAYIAEKNKKRFVIQDGKRVGDEIDDILLGPVFSPVGSTLAFAGKKAEKQVLQIGEKSLTFDQVGGFMFAADGKTLTYSVREGADYYDYFGPYKLLSSVGGGLVRSTPDGKHWMCVLTKGERETLYIDGKEHSTYDQVRFADYSNQGKLHWVAESGGKWRIHTLDGASPTYDELFGYGGMPRFDDKGVFHLLALRSGEYFRVSVP